MAEQELETKVDDAVLESLAEEPADPPAPESEIEETEAVEVEKETEKEAEKEPVNRQEDDDSDEQAKETVPLSTHLKTKSENKELRRRLDEIEAKLEIRPEQKQSAKSDYLPETVDELVEAGEVESDALLTVEIQRKLDSNRRKNESKRQEVANYRQMSENVSALDRTCRKFSSTIPTKHITAGLDWDSVVNEETLQELTTRDSREIVALPNNSAEKAKLIYEKCIARNPELTKRFQIVSSKPKPKNISATTTRVPRDRSAAQRSISQIDLLAAARSGKSEDDIFKEIGG